MLTTHKAPFYHLSFDDVLDCLIEVADRKISLFDHPLFAYFKHLHDTFGSSITLHVFYQKKIDNKLRSLQEVPDLKKYLRKSGADTWLFFGPHSLDFDTSPYHQKPSAQRKDFNRIYKEIRRFAGQKSYSRYVRLHYYSESYELASYFTKKGIDGLFTTDKPALSYRMGQRQKKQLIKKGFTKYNNFLFIKTQFRIEFYIQKKRAEIKKELQQNINTYNFITLYTHEYELVRKEIREKLELFLEELQQQEIPSILKP